MFDVICFELYDNNVYVTTFVAKLLSDAASR